MSEWRTSTVVDLCRAMRETRDYSALPILADALQDADYDDETILEQLRGRSEPLEQERLVALLMSDDSALAVRWMDDFAKACGTEGYADEGRTMTYELLMGTAREYLETGDALTEDGGMGWQDALYERTEDFWRNYELVTGTTVKDHTGHFFRCSC